MQATDHLLSCPWASWPGSLQRMLETEQGFLSSINRLVVGKPTYLLEQASLPDL